MFTTREQLEASLREAGVSPEGAALIVQAARPGVVIRTEAVQDEAEIPRGATKIGGSPDLPPGVPWPTRPPYPDAPQRAAAEKEGAAEVATWTFLSESTLAKLQQLSQARAAAVAEPAPLAFIAQIDLVEVARAGPVDSDCPRSGRLLLFYDMLVQPDGTMPGDVTGMALLFDEMEPHRLDRRPFPNAIAQDRFAPLACRVRAGLIPPAHGAAELTCLSNEDDEALCQWVLSQEHYERHCIGGHPQTFQGDMAEDCVRLDRGLDLTQGADGADIDREREDWVFLFQIASDMNNGMMWGDIGMLYVWIRRDALRARRFDEARLFFQST